MKILESKYYREIKILGVNGDDELELFDKNRYLTSKAPFRYLLSDLMCDIYLSNDDLIIQRDKLQHFIKCTDFYKVNYVYYNNNQSASVEGLKALFSEYLEKYQPKKAKVSILLKSQNGFDVKTHTIKPFRIDFDRMYNDDFLEVHNRVKKSITDENKGIVLFHGIAGSGKTNYIKWLTSQIPNKKFIFVPTSMIASLTDPSFIGVLIDHKNSVLVLEDCENYIAERTALNSNTDVVSSILNIADGMLSDVLECQLICTFNSDISKIDSALLRKGRLIAEYKFKELSVEKANNYLRSIGKEPTITKPCSLAELTNMETKALKEDTDTPKIGFK